MAQINLSGSIGVPGSVFVLGNSTVEYPSDADLVLTAAQYSTFFLDVTSSGALTATRKLVAPLNPGQTFLVQNNTTAGQSITIVGVSGTGVTIANGAVALVSTDGTNYFPVGGGSAATPTAPYTYNFAESGTQIVLNGPNQPVLFDQSGGSGTYPMPTVGLLPGTTFTYGDLNKAGAFTWGPHAPIFSVGAGVFIQDPNNSTNLVEAGTVQAVVQAGNSGGFMWDGVNTWLVAQ